jgi:WD40 repeat protein
MQRMVIVYGFCRFSHSCQEWAQETDAVDRHSCSLSNQPLHSETHWRSGRCVSTERFLYSTTGLIVRAATAIVATVCLVSWWEMGSISKLDNVLGTRPDRIMALASSTDGRTVASGGYGGSIAIWDKNRRKIAAVLDGERGSVVDLACSPDGSILAAAHVDTTVTIWDTKSWKLRRVLRAESRAMGCVAFSPDGTLLATARSDCAIALWETVTWNTRSILRGHSRPPTSLRFSTDSRTLASSSADSTVRLWAVSSGQSVRVLTPRSPAKQESINCLAISPAGQLLATFGLKSGLILWDMETGEQMTKLGYREGMVLNLMFSPDGRTLAAGTTGGEIEVWDVGSRHQRSALRGHSASIHGLVFAPDGGTLISASDDGTLRIWE